MIYTLLAAIKAASCGLAVSAATLDKISESLDSSRSVWIQVLAWKGRKYVPTVSI